jgi:hypothetical protein
MANYLVIPTHKNGYKAPGILCVGHQKGSEAIESAKSKSRLSESKDWRFNRNVKELYPSSLSGKAI